MKDVTMSMSRAWDKEKNVESPTGFESVTVMSYFSHNLTLTSVFIEVYALTSLLL